MEILGPTVFCLTRLSGVGIFPMLLCEALRSTRFANLLDQRNACHGPTTLKAISVGAARVPDEMKSMDEISFSGLGFFHS